MKTKTVLLAAIFAGSKLGFSLFAKADLVLRYLVALTAMLSPLRKSMFPICVMALTSILTVGLAFGNSDEFQREKLNFNQGWKFIRKNVPAAVDPTFSVKELERWESVDLPHTVRLEPYTNSSKSYQGPATYVKRFPSQNYWKGKMFYLEFEGVMGVTDVWVNGQHLSAKQAASTGSNSNYSGYLPFVIDISSAIKADGTENVITVIADNSDNPLVPPGKPQKNLDFSYFGGIYRDVWMHITNDIHISSALFEDIVGGGGIFVETTSASKVKATLSVKTHVRNESTKMAKMSIKQELFDSANTVVAQATTEVSDLGAKNDRSIETSLNVENPKLWSLVTPYMHTLVTSVYNNGDIVDRLETRVGIRTLRITREKGIEINGEPAGILSGGDLHQEYAYIGYAMPDSLHRRDVIKFKEAGLNAVRTGVYPIDPAFIKACDELGLLVFEPTPGWQWFDPNPIFRTRVSQNIQQMIRRDRNNPSIMAYELTLNETHIENEDAFNQISANVAKAEKPGLIYSLAAGCHVFDTVTGEMGTFGREYGDFMWAQDGNFKGSGRTERSPDFFYPGGEARMVKQARERMWEGGGQGYYLSSLNGYKKSPLSIGASMWTAIDHNRGYSVHGAACGMLDLYRIPKFIYYLYSSQRSAEKSPMVFIASHWTEKVPVFDKVTTVDFSLGTDALRVVDVYSNAAKVRLSVIKNGEKKWSQTQEPSIFMSNDMSTALMHAPPFLFVDVPYHKGTLMAEGLDVNGQVIAQHSVTTAGVPAKISLKADTEGIDLVADGSDIVSILATITDADGNVCSTASNEIAFTVKNGKIMGDGDKRVGSNPVKAVAGIIGIPVQSTYEPGDVLIEASSHGLNSARLIVQAKPMAQKSVPYSKIAQGALADQGSTFLANKEKMALGTVKMEEVTIGTNKFPNSISLDNVSASVDYYLNKQYERFTGKVGISIADRNTDGRGVIFKIYCDGVLKYSGRPLKFGETADYDLNVSGVDQLTLATADDKTAQRSGTASFLSPFIAEGTNDGIDESEIRQNLAPAMSPWSQDFKQGKPVWQIDLGKIENVRNALLKVQYDSMEYHYEIWTSPDNKSWTKQVSNKKTSHNNEILDTFSAKSVRYVKVTFTDVVRVGIDWGKVASITDFAIYKDVGVLSAKEYILKGITVEGKDLVFSPTIDTYSITQKGLNSQLKIRALPYDPQATVKINGTKINHPAGCNHMKDATPITIELEEGMNKVEIEVTSQSGSGKKVYTLNVDSDGGNSYNALECFVKNTNGAHGWWYEYQDIKSGVISHIALPMISVGDDQFAYGKNSNPWEFAGPLVMHPGNGTVNVLRTFKSPKAGQALINATARIKPNNVGNVLLRVYQNNTLIYPENGNGVLLGNSGEQIEKIENLPVKLAVGDEIRFVVDSNGSNGGDNTVWDTTVSFQPFDSSNVTSFEIKGSTIMTDYSDLNLRTQLYAEVKKNGETFSGVDADWSIVKPMKGLNIDRYGNIMVDAGVTDTTFNVKATLKGKQRFSDEKKVTVKRVLRPVNVKIPTDPSNVFGSPAYQDNESSLGCKKAFDGDTSTFFAGLAEGHVGIEVGKKIPVSAMRLVPRKDWDSRLSGGLIQASDDSAGPWTTLHTVADVIKGGEYFLKFPSPQTYRYYRIIQDQKRVFDVAEIEFFTAIAPKNSVYKNTNPKIQVVEALQSVNSKGWLDTQLKVKTDYDCDVLVAVAKVLDVDNKLDTTIEDSKVISMKANNETQVFLSAKWDVSKDVEVGGRQFGPQVKFIIRDIKGSGTCLEDGKITYEKL